MKIFVTGVAGFAGGFVAGKLAEGGSEVVGLCRRETGFSRQAEANGVSLLHGDLLETCDLPGRFDAVVHAAACCGQAGAKLSELVRDNIYGTQALIDAAERWGARAFVFFSSLSVHGDILAPVVDEHTPILNPNAYGISKRLGELMLEDCGPRMASMVLRLPGIVGPGAHRTWLCRIADKIGAGETVRAFALDSNFNSAVHVLDIANLIARVLGEEWRGSETLVLSAIGSISVREVIERLARSLGKDSFVAEIGESRPSYTISPDRAMQRWGYRPMRMDALLDRFASELRSAVMSSSAMDRSSV